MKIILFGLGLGSNDFLQGLICPSKRALQRIWGLGFRVPSSWAIRFPAKFAALGRGS